MAVNKVIFGNQSIIDISDTTATAEHVLSGKEFYGKDGVKVEGTYVPVSSGAECGFVTDIAANSVKYITFSQPISYFLCCTRAVGGANSTNTAWRASVPDKQTCQGTEVVCPNTARAGYIYSLSSDKKKFGIKATTSTSEIFYAGW